MTEDSGPNTGGMGAYAPVGFATPELLTRVRREVLEPTLREMASRGTVYAGVLYAGLMVARDGTLRVLEFNCRFGDPETQVVLPVLHRGVSADLVAIATAHTPACRCAYPRPPRTHRCCRRRTGSAASPPAR